MTRSSPTRYVRNGRPDYPPSTSVEQWYVNARESTEWAQAARAKARERALAQRRNRHLIAGVLWLVAAGILVFAIILQVT